MLLRRWTGGGVGVVRPPRGAVEWERREVRACYRLPREVGRGAAGTAAVTAAAGVTSTCLGSRRPSEHPRGDAPPLLGEPAPRPASAHPLPPPRQTPPPTLRPPTFLLGIIAPPLSPRRRVLRSRPRQCRCRCLCPPPQRSLRLCESTLCELPTEQVHFAPLSYESLFQKK